MKLTRLTFDESQKAIKSIPANTLELPVESRKGEEGRRTERCFGFKNRIRVERPSDIARRQLVSTRVLKESAQNFAEFRRNVLIAGFNVVLTILGRHFLPNTWAYGNPGSWRILTVCGIRRPATRDWFARAVFCRRFAAVTQANLHERG